MSFQLEAVVALVSARNERIDGGREVHLAASDAQIDVADDGITQMHMSDSAVKAADCIDLVITARNDVAEVQYCADGLISSASYNISDRWTVAHRRRECGASTSRLNPRR